MFDGFGHGGTVSGLGLGAADLDDAKEAAAHAVGCEGVSHVPGLLWRPGCRPDDRSSRDRGESWIHSGLLYERLVESLLREEFW